MAEFQRIGVVGGGAWGTALALAAGRAGRSVRQWLRDGRLAQSIRDRGVNDRYLPGLALAPLPEITADLAAAAAADVVLLVVPAQHVRAICRQMAPALRPGTPVVLCAKGIELGSDALMSEVLAAEVPAAVPAVLSGPTFAAEVARALPTAVTLASADRALGAALAAALGSRSFRPYWSDDLVGAQIGGAVKNVLAIACGIVQGRGLGDNARAALITRGLAEIVRLGASLGGRADTLMGLSGLGDLTLTCTSLQSRNMSLGVALGQGRSLAAVLAGRHSVAEGVTTASAVADLATRRGVDMPVCRTVDAILHRGLDIDQAVDDLMTRPLKAEDR